ncbi:uncharacterized protein RSE6_13875 [Rhynchosporium secalis]|uniref:Uncharacterized protein n=1 Tax=Rhynchosporium secalis TaxID=38038 RepID=A0A1E1MTW1_RHYSE|nr:uncharacterized protein RSE6_13875 [Rhynchosporium secalis]
MSNMDMDIEMDIDMGLTDDLGIPEIELLPDTTSFSGLQEPQPILNTPNDISDSNAHELTPSKVHLRGLDNLTDKDIRAFAAEYYGEHRLQRVEWIDDTSANIVYDTAEIAKAALMAFSAVEITDVSQIPVLQTIPAKSFPLHPDTRLEVRLAVVGDRKQAGARDRSRFYLFNPNYDRAEQRKRNPRGLRTYRDREDGGYRSQRYDDHEQQKRERDADFDASLYDDDEASLAKRSGGNYTHHRSSSNSETRRTQSTKRDKELFPERGPRSSGRLRDRSASPVRDIVGDQDLIEDRIAERRRQQQAAVSNRLAAQALKTAKLLDPDAPKELFPSKSSPSHRRSHAFDAADPADDAADLFSRIPIPLTDGSTDSRSRGGSLASRITGKGSKSSGFSIRGTAMVPPSQVFNIKGAARVKELFPATLGDNSGKELFSGRLEGRGGRRQKAEDLFS